MLRDFKFYDKYYVGVEKSRYENTDDQRLLGFATPIDDTSAYKKRKETVDRWRDKTVEPLTIDNTPTFGFEIVDVVSRYRTDNKLYRIFDPRGFEIEISAENLFDLLMNNTVVKGKIMEPLVFARYGAKNYLVSSSCDEYKNYLSPKKETPTLAPGQCFTHRNNSKIIYRYEGRFHGIYLEKEINTYNPANYSNRYYNSYYGPRHKKQTRGGVQTYVKYDWKTASKEPFEIYTEFHLDKEDKVQAYKVHLRKSKLKNLDYLCNTSDNIEISSFEIPVGKYLAQFKVDFGVTEITNEHYGNVYQTSKLDYITNGYLNSPDIQRREMILFKTRAEANEYKITIAKANAILDPLARYKYQNGAYVKSPVQNLVEFGTVFYELFKDGVLVEEFE